jgi:hypothetical protein
MVVVFPAPGGACTTAFTPLRSASRTREDREDRVLRKTGKTGKRGKTTRGRDDWKRWIVEEVPQRA